MTGYCRLCRLRLEMPAVTVPADVPAAELEYFALAGAMLGHLQRDHGDAFRTVLHLSARFQSVIAGYLLDPPPDLQAGGLPSRMEVVSARADLDTERHRVKQSLSDLLGSDNPCQVNQVQPAMEQSGATN